MPYSYFLVYKPFGVLSQFTTPIEGKLGLGSLYDFPKDVYPVGRLDEDSEGLLLLTNDGSANKRLLGQGIEKTYWVQVEGNISEVDLDPFRKGLTIKVNKEIYQTLPARAQVLAEEPSLPERNPPIRFRASIPTSWIEVVLREGKNRQVRKMTAAIGFPTLRLVRVRFGKLELGKMQPGEVLQLIAF
jgi:23S rRNA pseudouridine2457 synthase